MLNGKKKEEKKNSTVIICIIEVDYLLGGSIIKRTITRIPTPTASNDFATVVVRLIFFNRNLNIVDNNEKYSREIYPPSRLKHHRGRFVTRFQNKRSFQDKKNPKLKISIS